MILKPGWRLKCSPGKDKKQIERVEEVKVEKCCGRRMDQEMGGMVGGRGDLLEEEVAVMTAVGGGRGAGREKGFVNM